MADGSLDLITTAFGFRNLANYQAGLGEFFRVLAPGGEVGILDFSEPLGIMGKVFRFYFRRVLPAIGARISGDAVAYGYLPSSVEKFPAPPAMLEMMRGAGFVEVSWTPYTFGIAGLWRGVKPETCRIGRPLCKEKQSPLRARRTRRAALLAGASFRKCCRLELSMSSATIPGSSEPARRSDRSPWCRSRRR